MPTPVAGANGSNAAPVSSNRAGAPDIDSFENNLRIAFHRIVGCGDTGRCDREANDAQLITWIENSPLKVSAGPYMYSNDFASFNGVLGDKFAKPSSWPRADGSQGVVWEFDYGNGYSANLVAADRRDIKVVNEATDLEVDALNRGQSVRHFEAVHISDRIPVSTFVTEKLRPRLDTSGNLKVDEQEFVNLFSPRNSNIAKK